MSVRVQKRIKIREPIWSSKSVGINLGGLESGLIEIMITHKNKSDNFTYPGSYYIDASRVKMFPIQRVAFGTPLHIVPITELGFAVRV